MRARKSTNEEHAAVWYVSQPSCQSMQLLRRDWYRACSDLLYRAKTKQPPAENTFEKNLRRSDYQIEYTADFTLSSTSILSIGASGSPRIRRGPCFYRVIARKQHEKNRSTCKSVSNGRKLTRQESNQRSLITHLVYIKG